MQNMFMSLSRTDTASGRCEPFDFTQDKLRGESRFILIVQILVESKDSHLHLLQVQVSSLLSSE